MMDNKSMIQGILDLFGLFDIQKLLNMFRLGQERLSINCFHFGLGNHEKNKSNTSKETVCCNRCMSWNPERLSGRNDA